MKEKLPNPKALAAFARSETRPPKPHAEDYLEVIETLREDKRSWREIAEWLTAHGVELTHNQVYKAFQDAWGDENSFWQAVQDRERDAYIEAWSQDMHNPDDDNPDVQAAIDGYDPDK